MTNVVDYEYIFRVVHLGDLQEFESILDGHPGLNINIQNADGESLLIHSVKRLGTKWTALIGGDFRAICKSLMRRGIDVNLKDASGKTAAHYAAGLEQLEVLRILIQKGAHIDMTVLESVIDKEDWILAICASLARDSNVEPGQDNSGEKITLKLFHRLLLSSNFSCIRWMCELFPEIIGKQSEDFLTALHIVARENNMDALKILLEYKANLEVADCQGHTALHFAVDNGHLDCMLSLLESGAAVNCQDISGATPLHYTINAGSDDVSYDIIVEHLLKFGADTTLADENGRLPLHWAANAGKSNMCVMMVEHGSPVNSRCNDGHTALHIAASQGHIECIRVLVVQCSADVDIEDEYGHTPLFNAITTKHIHCAELLLYEDASPNHCNVQENSPAHLAASKGLTEALELLVKYQGSLELKNMNGDLPLHEAALFQQREALDYILKCRCEVNVRNKQGFTPLHLAASVGSITCCECLLKEGAYLNIINSQCKNGLYKFLTALDLSQLNKHSQCVSFLLTRGAARGEQIVKYASRRIQRWWRKHRKPSKVKLKSVEEYERQRITLQKTIERVTEDDGNCAPKIKSKDEDRKSVKRDKILEVESTNYNIATSTIGVNDASNEAKGKTMESKYNNDHKAESSKNSKMQTPLKINKKGKCNVLKTSLINKPAITPHPPPPINKSSRIPGNQSRGNESRQAVKTALPSSEPSSKKREEEKIAAMTSDVISSKLEQPDEMERELLHSLEVEISRKEKLSREIARLKQNLEERSQRLESRLEAIEKCLDK